MGIKPVGVTDPYYRKPRRATMDLFSPSPKKHTSFASEDLTKRRSDAEALERPPPIDAGEGPSISRRGTPVQAHLGSHKDEFDDVTNELTRTKTDYAVREVDYYYGVRGPALSSGTRKLKTGPADPTGPVSSATGWFKGVFGGKTKDKGKGFEVVRSSRAPPAGLMTPSERPTTALDADHKPYNDNEEELRDMPDTKLDVAEEAEDDDLDDVYRGPYTDEDLQIPRVSPEPPSLPAIDTFSGIELPDRLNSHTSQPTNIPYAPSVPTKSSRRQASLDARDLTGAELSNIIAKPQDYTRVSSVSASPPPSVMAKGKEARKRDSYWPAPPTANDQNVNRLTPTASNRLPFTSAQANLPGSNRMSLGAESTVSSIYPVEMDAENQAPDLTYHDRNSSSALGVHAPDLRGDRPSSMGFVQQYRASDHIHHSPDSPEYAGSSAEFIGTAR